MGSERKPKPFKPGLTPKGPKVGCYINLPGNNSEMFHPGSRTIPRCKGCGFMLEFDSTYANFSLSKRLTAEEKSNAPALSLTLDLRTIASREFKQFCEAEQYPNLRFVPLPQDKAFFHLQVDNVIEVDETRCKVKREELCPICKNYKLVGGKTDYWKIAEPLDDGFYRGNILKGAGNAKRYPLYVGLPTQIKLEKAGLIKLNAYELIYGTLPETSS